MYAKSTDTKALWLVAKVHEEIIRFFNALPEDDVVDLKDFDLDFPWHRLTEAEIDETNVILRQWAGIHARIYHLEDVVQTPLADPKSSRIRLHGVMTMSST